MWPKLSLQQHWSLRDNVLMPSPLSGVASPARNFTNCCTAAPCLTRPAQPRWTLVETSWRHGDKRGTTYFTSKRQAARTHYQQAVLGLSALWGAFPIWRHHPDAPQNGPKVDARARKQGKRMDGSCVNIEKLTEDSVFGTRLPKAAVKGHNYHSRQS